MPLIDAESFVDASRISTLPFTDFLIASMALTPVELWRALVEACTREI